MPHRQDTWGRQGGGAGRWACTTEEAPASLGVTACPWGMQVAELQESHAAKMCTTLAQHKCVLGALQTKAKEEKASQNRWQGAWGDHKEGRGMCTTKGGRVYVYKYAEAGREEETVLEAEVFIFCGALSLYTAPPQLQHRQTP